MITARQGLPVGRGLECLPDEQAIPARRGWPKIDWKVLRYAAPIPTRTAWPAARALSRLPLIVSFAVAFFCTACGQTGPLTLDRPVDAAAATEPAVVETDEPDEPGERDDGDESDNGATDGGSPGAGER